MDPKEKEKDDCGDLTPEQLEQFYAKARSALTEADVKWFENPGELIPFEQVISEVELDLM